MHHGDISEFNSIITTNSTAYHSQPALTHKHEEIKKKIILLSLITMIFERHSHDRLLTFTEIALRIQVPIQQIEWVLMSALSQGLIKGHIDEVGQSVEVSWVLPRVLDKV